MSSAMSKKTIEWKESNYAGQWGVCVCVCVCVCVKGMRLAAVTAQLMSLNLCVICWGSPTTHPVACVAALQRLAPPVSGTIREFTCCESQRQSENSCRLSQELSGAGRAPTEGGWIQNREFSFTASVSWSTADSRVPAELQAGLWECYYSGTFLSAVHHCLHGNW